MSSADLEHLHDALHFFAEECDRLEAIDVLLDVVHVPALGEILDRLREDYGTAISLPVWVVLPDCEGPIRSYRALVEEHGLQVFYASDAELADLVVPLTVPSTTRLEIASSSSRWSESKLALALHTAHSYRTAFESSESLVSTRDWMSSATSLGRLPVATFEAMIPGIESRPEGLDTWSFIEESLEALNTSSLTSPSLLYSTHRARNPFMVPFFSHQRTGIGYVKPFANVVAFNGCELSAKEGKNDFLCSPSRAYVDG